MSHRQDELYMTSGCCCIFIGFLIASLIHIIVVSNRIETVCTVDDKDIENYICPQKRCSGCQSCRRDDLPCSSLMDSKTAGECCDGYHCCRQRRCDDPPCGCAHSVSDQACTVSTPTCYNPSVTVSYESEYSDFPIVYTHIPDFGCDTDLDCAEDFIDTFPEVGDHLTCWYTKGYDEPVYNNDHQHWIFWCAGFFGIISLYSFYHAPGFPKLTRTNQPQPPNLPQPLRPPPPLQLPPFQLPPQSPLQSPPQPPPPTYMESELDRPPSYSTLPVKNRGSKPSSTLAGASPQTPFL